MILVGTSGWQYRDWRERFYPRGLPQRQWLEWYAATFATVEVNNAFYRLPERKTFESWRDRTPDDFVVTVKMSRYLTHIKRLREPQEPVARFLDRAAGLGGRLGPVLLQLPPSLPADAGLLDAVLAEFPTRVRVAVEPRHPSWWVPAIRDTLARRGAALCWADRLGRPVTPLWRTADFGYLRLHEGRARPRPGYGRRALGTWLDRIVAAYEPDRPVYVYFNNDPGGAAIRDAHTLHELARHRGLEVSRATARPADFRPADSGVADFRAADSRRADSGVADSRPGLADSRRGIADSRPADSRPPDSGPPDSGLTDSRPADRAGVG